MRHPRPRALEDDARHAMRALEPGAGDALGLRLPAATEADDGRSARRRCRGRQLDFARLRWLHVVRDAARARHLPARVRWRPHHLEWSRGLRHGHAHPHDRRRECAVSPYDGHDRRRAGRGHLGAQRDARQRHQVARGGSAGAGDRREHGHRRRARRADRRQ